jgi:acetyltransferase-like isoleucine patch superfamily enzyme
VTTLSTARVVPGDWFPGTIPDNARLDEGAYVETSYSFSLCRSRLQPAVTMGEGASAYLGTMFDVGETGRVRVGRFALLNGARIICDGRVDIGDHALISWNVVIMDTYRVPVDPVLRRRQLRFGPPPTAERGDHDVGSRPVTLEANVWVGFDSCILPGVTIGEGSIVGARSVVVGDVPPLCIAAGNPAKLIRSVREQDRSP